MLSASMPTHVASSGSQGSFLRPSASPDTALSPGGASIRSVRRSLCERNAEGATVSTYGLSPGFEIGHSGSAATRPGTNLAEEAMQGGADAVNSEVCGGQQSGQTESVDDPFPNARSVVEIPGEAAQSRSNEYVQAEDLVYDILAINTLAMQCGKVDALDETIELLNEAYAKLNTNEHLVNDAQLLDQLRAMTLNNMGVTECRRGQPRHALSHFEAARQLEESHDIASPSVTLNSCTAYNALGSYEKATAAALEVIDMLRTLEMQRQRAKKIAQKRPPQKQISQKDSSDALMDAPDYQDVIDGHCQTQKSGKSLKERKNEVLLNDLGEVTIADSDNKMLWGAAWHNLAVAQLNTARHATRKQDIESERSNILVIFRNAMKATQDFLGLNHPMTKAVVETYRAMRVVLYNGRVFKQHHTLLTAPPRPLDPREQELEELMIEPKPGCTRHGTMELQKRQLSITFRGDTTSWGKLVERLDPTPYPGAKQEIYQSKSSNRTNRHHRTRLGGVVKSSALGSIPLSSTLMKAAQVYGNPHPLLYTPSPPTTIPNPIQVAENVKEQSNRNQCPQYKQVDGKTAALQDRFAAKPHTDLGNGATPSSAKYQYNRAYDGLMSTNNWHSAKIQNLAHSPDSRTASHQNGKLSRLSTCALSTRSLDRGKNQNFPNSSFPAVMNQTKCIMMAVPTFHDTKTNSDRIAKTTYYTMPVELSGTEDATEAVPDAVSYVDEPTFPPAQQTSAELCHERKVADQQRIKAKQDKSASKFYPPPKRISTATHSQPRQIETSDSISRCPAKAIPNFSSPLLPRPESFCDKNVSGDLFDTMWVSASPVPVDAGAGVTGRLQLCPNSMDALWFDSNGLAHGNRIFSRPEYFPHHASDVNQTQQSHSHEYPTNRREYESSFVGEADQVLEVNLKAKLDRGDGMVPMALKAHSNPPT